MIHDPMSKARQMREGFEEIARSVPKWLGAHDREDAIQDASVELLKIIENQAVGSNLKALAGLIVRRKAARRLEGCRRDRRFAERAKASMNATESRIHNPYDRAVCNETESALHNAMYHLDDIERSVIQLRFMQELTYDRIVAKLALRDRNEVGTILRRAMKKLRSMLQSYG